MKGLQKTKSRDVNSNPRTCPQPKIETFNVIDKNSNIVTISGNIQEVLDNEFLDTKKRTKKTKK